MYPVNSFWRLSDSILKGSAPLHSTLYHHPTFRPSLLTSPLFSAIFLTFLMSQPSSPSSFQDLFNTALGDYQIQTGIRLADHTFAKQLEACNSVDSVTAILQEQAQIFREFRGDDGKITKPLKSSVDVLYSLSNSTVIGQGTGLVHPNP